MLLSAHLGTDFERNTPLSNADYQRYASFLSGKVASDYLGFMLDYNGGEGPVGEENYLSLFRLEDVPAYNQACSALEGTSGFIIFASDGGNTVYAFRGPDAVVEFDLIGLTTEEALFIAEDFTGFLASLASSDSD
jgi:hypothetical protein